MEHEETQIINVNTIELFILLRFLSIEQKVFFFLFFLFIIVGKRAATYNFFFFFFFFHFRWSESGNILNTFFKFKFFKFLVILKLNLKLYFHFAIFGIFLCIILNMTHKSSFMYGVRPCY